MKRVRGAHRRVGAAGAVSPVTLLAPAALAAFAAAAAHAETPPQTRPQTLAQTLAQTRAETLAQTLPQTPSDFATYRPRLVAQRLSGPPPTIDGDLSDPAWREAATTEAFYQVVPEVGPPSEKTRAYIAYDDRHLYIALYMFDREPSAITRNLMERDPPLQDDDGVRVIIDPFGTNRDGFFFAMNPNGARNDALIENNNTFRDQWDTVWRGKARVVEDGWVAEMAIPFQSMSFDRNLENWGFQIVRTIRRKNEEIRWSNVDRARGRIDLTNPGALAGITGVKSGRGVEGQIFLAANATRDHELQDTATEVDPSANLFYRITPSLTGSVTVNTDFADQPLDARQVNTGRFSLFFPETRNFFLQDAASYEFGGQVYRNTPNGLPFFTRRIGIVDGAPVDIVAGAKISGKAGAFNIGAISARTGAQGALDGQTLSAIRVSRNVLAESKVGVIATHGDPQGEATNTVYGADFQYRNSSLIGDGQTLVDVAYLRSEDDPDGPEGNRSGNFAGVRAAYVGDLWNTRLNFQHLGEDYAPRLGFANRTGIRRYRAVGFRNWRVNGERIRNIETGAYGIVVTDLDDRALDRDYGIFGEIENNVGDGVEFEIGRAYEEILEPFDIAGELPVAAGRYRFNTYEFGLYTAEARPVSVGAFVFGGGSYNGRRIGVSGSIDFRPSRFFRLAAEYEFERFDLETGALGIHIATVNNTIAFKPDMTLKTDLQYDNISETFTVFSRFAWEPIPTRELFVSLGHSAFIDRENFPQRYRAQASGAAIRLGYTFRL